MNDIIQQLKTIAQTKDSVTKQKILALQEELLPLLASPRANDELGISPDTISQAQDILPQVRTLVDIVKSMLINQSNGMHFNVKQKTIVSERQKRCPGQPFSYGRLDAMERIYRASGRIVEYDAPGYTESYDANFTFKRKK